MQNESSHPETPCDRCPWRLSNHGRRTKWGFYTKRNRRRLWNGIRRGNPQSCHPTDPSHPDHVEAGAKPGSEPKECPGAVIVAMRELQKIASYSDDGETIDVDAWRAYQSDNPQGMTRDGLIYWGVERYQFAGMPFVGGKPLPKVDLDDPRISVGEF